VTLDGARGHSEAVRVASGARGDGQWPPSTSLGACCDRGKPRVDSGSGVSGGTNRLLDTLPAAQRHRLMAAVSHVRLEPKTVLFEPGQRIDVVDFPCTCVVSLITPFHDGSTVEVASVGNEGIVGVPVVLGGSLAVQAICSVGGWIDRMEATTFTHEVESDVDLHEVVDDYLRAVFNQLSQAVACNRLHSTTERLARWLLASADRLGTDEFAVTHHLLGQLLGSGGATVSRAAQHLQAGGLINSRRGRITIVDRPGLETVACECYGVIKAELDGVIERAVIRFGGAQAPAVRAHAGRPEKQEVDRGEN
jgi:Crp-like helix-turn-helix domain